MGLSAKPTITISQKGAAGGIASLDVSSKLPLSQLPIHTHPLSVISQSGAVNGQVPQWNGASWVPSIAASAIQPDWNQTINTANDYIRNKPVIPTGGAAQIQTDWNQTNTAAADFLRNKPNITAANVKLPTIIVALSGGDFNNVQAALDLAASTYQSGCRIYIKNGTYNISSTLLLKCDNLYIYCESAGVQFNVTASTFCKAQLSAIGPTTGVGRLRCVWDGGTIQNSNTVGTGIGFDCSNWGVCQITKRTFILSFNKAQYFKDTNNQSFYSTYEFQSYDNNYGVYVDPTSLPVNFNLWNTPEMGINALAAGNTGYFLNNAENNTFLNCACEPPVQTNTRGFYFGIACISNIVIQCYLENSAVGVEDVLANYSGNFGPTGNTSRNNMFIGGTISGNALELKNTSNIMFQNTHVGYFPYNTVKLGITNNSAQSRPVANPETEGVMWYDPITKRPQFCNGTTWISL